ncbi:MAG TPA: hypothetical protein DCW87_11225 [Comamonadaceae bacterium]|nr:hypothetical protein [Comamonadaceae bacterium]
MAKIFSTVRELIYWEYAKLVAGRVAGRRQQYAFVNYVFRQFSEQKMSPASILVENKKLFLEADQCAYCGNSAELQWEHIIPLAMGGPDSIDNLVRACRSCNLEKGARDPYQWYAARHDLDGIPRLVLGKFLKLVFERYADVGLLDDSSNFKTNHVERVTLGQVFRAPALPPVSSGEK